MIDNDVPRLAACTIVGWYDDWSLLPVLQRWSTMHSFILQSC